MWLRGQYDYWNTSIGAGYATGVQVWMNPASSGGGGSPIVPEPATFLLPLLIGANYLRRRRRRA